MGYENMGIPPKRDPLGEVYQDYIVSAGLDTDEKKSSLDELYEGCIEGKGKYKKYYKLLNNPRGQPVHIDKNITLESNFNESAISRVANKTANVIENVVETSRNIDKEGSIPQVVQHAAENIPGVIEKVSEKISKGRLSQAKLAKGAAKGNIFSRLGNACKKGVARSGKFLIGKAFAALGVIKNTLDIKEAIKEDKANGDRSFMKTGRKICEVAGNVAGGVLTGSVVSGVIGFVSTTCIGAASVGAAFAASPFIIGGLIVGGAVAIGYGSDYVGEKLGNLHDNLRQRGELSFD